MKKHDFQPKEWVLVRDLDEQKWKLDIFSHYIEGNMYPYRCVSANYAQCIPYEGSESLLGTNKPADAPMEIGGWKVGDKVEVEYDTDKKWYGGEIVRINLNNRSWVDSEVMPYYVRSECFKYNDGCAWCAARQLRKPEEKPEEEDGWRPKQGEAIEVDMGGVWRSAKLLFDDHTPTMPYRVHFDNGEVRWCNKCDVRPAQKETEEPFKFGDMVEVCIDGEWCEAVVIEIDHSDIPYKVATADGDVRWCAKSRVRRA